MSLWKKRIENVLECIFMPIEKINQRKWIKMDREKHASGKAEVSFSENQELKISTITFPPWDYDIGFVRYGHTLPFDILPFDFSKFSLYEYMVLLKFENGNWILRFGLPKLQILDQMLRSCPESLNLIPSDSPREAMKKVDRFLLFAKERVEKVWAFE